MTDIYISQGHKPYLVFCRGIISGFFSPPALEMARQAVPSENHRNKFFWLINVGISMIRTRRQNQWKSSGAARSISRITNDMVLPSTWLYPHMHFVVCHLNIHRKLCLLFHDRFFNYYWKICCLFIYLSWGHIMRLPQFPPEFTLFIKK